MARLCSNPVGLHRFRPFSQSLHQPSLLIKTSHQSQPKTRRFPSIIACQTSPNPPETEKEKVVIDNENEKDLVSNSTNQSTSPSPDSGSIQFPNREFSKRVALFSTLGAVGFFIFTRLDLGVSLKDLSAAALPYEEALGNGKPTVVEFYADWCEVCRELAPDVYKVEQQYKNRVNFVMLNVDNTRWEQELDEFGVEGIPHFAFLDREGNEEGNVVGRLPRKYLLENVDALARGEASVPHARVVGQYTSAENRKVHQIVDPRSHG
ncbi:hypothetical protein LWI28_026325 [Acer negundo]|uniref:Thioredoxin-like protein HCF164, chloroplastic n=1 Tax=Acer negundo TaxID=4023 RepID=A0AAD5IKG9_ACENE|nr:hypothetical protein LWI28_026325 [Acer negundo]KAK4840682.1 hypothetical protein QYF36_015579 [Acer negundo]